jgi:hypothetical protein
MAKHVLVELELPPDLERFCIPEGVHQRLQQLLDRRDLEENLTPREQQEAESLVHLAELLSLLRLCVQEVSREPCVST